MARVERCVSRAGSMSSRAWINQSPPSVLRSTVGVAPEGAPIGRLRDPAACPATRALRLNARRSWRRGSRLRGRRARDPAAGPVAGREPGRLVDAQRDPAGRTVQRGARRSTGVAGRAAGRRSRDMCCLTQLAARAMNDRWSRRAWGRREEMGPEVRTGRAPGAQVRTPTKPGGGSPTASSTSCVRRARAQHPALARTPRRLRCSP